MYMYICIYVYVYMCVYVHLCLRVCIYEESSFYIYRSLPLTHKTRVHPLRGEYEYGYSWGRPKWNIISYFRMIFHL